jgi:hypothetical protein
MATAVARHDDKSRGWDVGSKRRRLVKFVMAIADAKTEVELMLRGKGNGHRQSE